MKISLFLLFFMSSFRRKKVSGSKMGILPVAILWGIIWIRQGLRKQQHIVDEEEVAIKQMFFDEGRLAFSNGKDITENPHAETDKDCAEAWAAGWREAYRLRQKLYEK